jgi:hypothetical protein
MTTVICEVCEKNVPQITCWCVIDTKNKTRHFECKINCKPIPAPKSTPTIPPQTSTELELSKQNLKEKVKVKVNEKEKESEIRKESTIVITETVPEWAEAYPRPNIFKRILYWFYVPDGYTKVKTS